MKKTPKILLIATLICIAVYIGVFIGRSSAGKLITITGQSSAQDDVSTEDLLININTATVDELTLIPDVTPALASRIVEFRQEYGDYIDILELMEVDGITRSVYDSIKQYVTVDD